jgi:hypothetical protein
MTGRTLSDAGIAAPKNVTRKMSFKRNQIETAIAHMYDPGCQEPPPELRTRIKRLLELDRSRGRKLRATDAEEANFAFFNEEAPGTGADISFSQYEACAGLNALRIMDHGWPQGFAVSIMRRIRPDLEKEHARILRQPPEKLFDWQVIRARARPGDIAVDNTDPVFIVLATPIRRSPDEAQTAPVSAGVPRMGPGPRIQSKCVKCKSIRGCNARAQAASGVVQQQAEISRSSAVHCRARLAGLRY